MYKIIKNPLTGKQININTKLGKIYIKNVYSIWKRNKY